MVPSSTAHTEYSDYDLELDESESKNVVEEPMEWRIIPVLIMSNVISIGILIHCRKTEDRWFEIAFCVWPIFVWLWTLTLIRVYQHNSRVQSVVVWSHLFQFGMIFAIAIVSTRRSMYNQNLRDIEERFQNCLEYQGSFNTTIDCEQYRDTEQSLIDMFIVAYNLSH